MLSSEPITETLEVKWPGHHTYLWGQGQPRNGGLPQEGLQVQHILCVKAGRVVKSTALGLQVALNSALPPISWVTFISLCLSFFISL